MRQYPKPQPATRRPPASANPTAAQLADLFGQLSRLESAGFPALQGFDLLKPSGQNLAKPLASLRRHLQAGLPISEAGYKAGLFDPSQQALIHAGESSGALAAVYTELAGYYALKHRLRQKIVTRCYLPGLTLILALFLQPLPACVTGDISGLSYLQLSLGRLVGLAALIWLASKQTQIAAAIGLERQWHGLQLRTPWLGAWIVDRQINDFIMLLGMLLEAGVSFADALPKAVASIKNSALREQFAPLTTLARLHQGDSVAEILAEAAVIEPKIRQVILSSEKSGKLGGGLLRYAKLQAENLRLQDEALADWLPRIVHTLVAVWVGSAVIGSWGAILRGPV